MATWDLQGDSTDKSIQRVKLHSIFLVLALKDRQIQQAMEMSGRIHEREYLEL